MPRLVRRQSLWERVSTMLNPMDFLLWLSEEMETRDWDSGILGTQLGLGLNFAFLLVRANSGSKPASDDIFGDSGSSSWLSMLLYPLSWGLIALSIINTVYTISRTRKYRLFEANINIQPSTSSARRVRVQSSPLASSPLRFLSDLVSSDSADSRADPDKTRDVWELSVWDPLPVCVRLLCLFSPGHVLVYLVFLPLAPLDPRPSVTLFNTLIMQLVLSAQMILLSSRYSQQAKDSAIIQKEVFNEYDTKFVHPRIHPVVRDVGTQMSEDQPPISREFVQVGTPTTLIRRSFITNGNLHADVGEPTPIQKPSTFSVNSGSTMKSQMFTPSSSRRSEMFTPTISSHRSSGLRHSLPAGYTPKIQNDTPVPFAPAASPSIHSIGTSMGLHSATTSNLGSYSQRKSPLKKTVSMYDMNNVGHQSPRDSREMAAYEQHGNEAPSSPTKYSEPRRYTSTNLQSSPHPFANMGKHSSGERFPKRWRGV